MSNQADKQAIFNAALGTIIRLNDNMNEMVLVSNEGDYKRWHECLWNVASECWPKWDIEVQEKVKKDLNSIVELVNNYNRISVSGRQPSLKTMTELYGKLKEIELYIRIHADAAGLLNPNKGDIMDGLRTID